MTPLTAQDNLVGWLFVGGALIVLGATGIWLVVGNAWYRFRIWRGLRTQQRLDAEAADLAETLRFYAQLRRVAPDFDAHVDQALAVAKLTPVPDGMTAVPLIRRPSGQSWGVPIPREGES